MFDVCENRTERVVHIGDASIDRATWLMYVAEMWKRIAVEQTARLGDIDIREAQRQVEGVFALETVVGMTASAPIRQGDIS